VPKTLLCREARREGRGVEAVGVGKGLLMGRSDSERWRGRGQAVRVGFRYEKKGEREGGGEGGRRERTRRRSREHVHTASTYLLASPLCSSSKSCCCGCWTAAVGETGTIGVLAPPPSFPSSFVPSLRGT